MLLFCIKMNQKSLKNNWLDWNQLVILITLSIYCQFLPIGQHQKDFIVLLLHLISSGQFNEMASICQLVRGKKACSFLTLFCQYRKYSGENWKSSPIYADVSFTKLRLGKKSQGKLKLKRGEKTKLSVKGKERDKLRFCEGIWFIPENVFYAETSLFLFS